MQDFKKLEIWAEAIDFSCDVYEKTRGFPQDEKYGIVSQLRRASVSISTNIAEGAGRRTSPDFAKFLSIAFGSVNECETLLIVSRKLGYFSEKDFEQLSKKVVVLGKRIHSFIQRISQPKTAT